MYICMYIQTIQVFPKYCITQMLPKCLTAHLVPYSQYKQQRLTSALQSLHIPAQDLHQAQAELEQILMQSIRELLESQCVEDLCSLVGVLLEVRVEGTQKGTVEGKEGVEGCGESQGGGNVVDNGVVFWVVENLVECLTPINVYKVIRVFVNQFKDFYNLGSLQMYRIAKILNHSIKTIPYSINFSQLSINIPPTNPSKPSQTNPQSNNNEIALLRGQIHMILANMLGFIHRSGLEPKVQYRSSGAKHEQRIVDANRYVERCLTQEQYEEVVYRNKNKEKIGYVIYHSYWSVYKSITLAEQIECINKINNGVASLVASKQPRIKLTQQIINSQKKILCRMKVLQSQLNSLLQYFKYTHKQRYPQEQKEGLIQSIQLSSTQSQSQSVSVSVSQIHITTTVQDNKYKNEQEKFESFQLLSQTQSLNYRQGKDKDTHGQKQMQNNLQNDPLSNILPQHEIYNQSNINIAPIPHTLPTTITNPYFQLLLATQIQSHYHTILQSLMEPIHHLTSPQSLSKEVYGLLPRSRSIYHNLKERIQETVEQLRKGRRREEVLCGQVQAGRFEGFVGGFREIQGVVRGVIRVCEGFVEQYGYAIATNSLVNTKRDKDQMKKRGKYGQYINRQLKRLYQTQTKWQQLKTHYKHATKTNFKLLPPHNCTTPPKQPTSTKKTNKKKPLQKQDLPSQATQPNLPQNDNTSFSSNCTVDQIGESNRLVLEKGNGNGSVSGSSCGQEGGIGRVLGEIRVEAGRRLEIVVDRIQEFLMMDIRPQLNKINKCSPELTFMNNNITSWDSILQQQRNVSQTNTRSNKIAQPIVIKTNNRQKQYQNLDLYSDSSQQMSIIQDFSDQSQIQHRKTICNNQKWRAMRTMSRFNISVLNVFPKIDWESYDTQQKQEKSIKNANQRPKKNIRERTYGSIELIDFLSKKRKKFKATEQMQLTQAEQVTIS